ncbi:MAG: S1 RNA-binding domain-containing protein [bacterium]|nr:S1 RNA-binding domain-containing protein [bacterium]
MMSENPHPTESSSEAPSSETSSGDGDMMDDALAREVEQAMAGMSPEDMASLSPATVPEGADTPDAVVRGTVVAIHGDDVFVDLGEKHQGVVPLSQYGGKKAQLSIGQALEVVVDRTDVESGLIHCSREGAVRPADWNTIKRGMIVEGRVTGMNKGGLELILKGIHGFMPASQVAERSVRDISCYIGETLRCEVISVHKRDKSVTLSRRKVEERERAEALEKLLAELEVGQVRKGVVSNLAEYGAFVDLGGVDGLVHISDLSYAPVDKVSDVLSPGQEIDVKVLKIDTERQRISLGVRQVQPDPWDRVADKYTAGEQLRVRVTRLADFGAFAALEDGVDGLIPLSEMSWTRIPNAAAVVEPGQLVEVVVIRVDANKRRIALSMKQAQPDPWAEVYDAFPENAIIEGKVTRLADFGAFIELLPGVEGLAHISELSEQRIRHCGEVVQAGQEVKVRVLKVEPEQRRISLSLKLADADAAHSMEDANAPRPEQSKKRKKPLRGGLEGGWDWQGLSM